MPKMIFINLPVRDLAASTRFYEAIGCTKNPMFSSEDASSMVWEENIMFMLLTHSFFSTFTTRPIADPRTTVSALIALSCDSRQAVDEVVAAAVAAGGGGDIRPAQDMSFMYGRTFEDPDGNIFEPTWMDPSGFSEAGADAAAHQPA